MWSKIQKLQGLRAAKNWLSRLAPDRQVRVRKTYRQSVRKIELALAGDADLLKAFRMVVEHAQFFGRVEGLREGLDLYEYGARIQQENTGAFRTIMNYIIRCAERCEGKALEEMTRAEEVCEYLDREIARHKLRTSEVLIGPPERWGCDSWSSALEKKSNSVHSLISKAKKEALSDKYSTLMAWKAWCRESKSKGREIAPEQESDGQAMVDAVSRTTHI